MIPVKGQATWRIFPKRFISYSCKRDLWKLLLTLLLLIPSSGSATHNSRFSPCQLFGDLQKWVSQTACICFRADSFLFNLPARKLVNTASSFKLPSTLHFGSTIAKSLRMVTFVFLAPVLYMQLFVELKLPMHSPNRVCVQFIPMTKIRLVEKYLRMLLSRLCSYWTNIIVLLL